MSKKFMQLPDQINKQAAEWFTLMQSADVSAAERLALRDWLSADADHQEAYNQIEAVWESLGDLSGTADAEALRRSVEPFTDQLSEKLKALLLAPVAMVKSLITAPKYAMGFAIVVAVGVFLVPGTNEPITAHYSTQIGEIKTITLADSSEITLGAMSKISTRISDTGRSVNLISGEAFFNVAKDRQKPFAVSVNNVSIEVVGTQFNVQRIRDDVSVAVLEGIVNVFGSSAGERLTPSLPDVVLTAGQKVIKASDQAFESVTSVLSADLGAWRVGRLIYTDTSVIDVLTDAGRYFDGKIVLQSDDLADVKVSMTLRTDQVSQLPQMLSEALPLEVHVVSDNIILLKN